MRETLLNDTFARVVLLLWIAFAGAYFIPAVPHDLLVLFGERYSTLPFWPWAVIACLHGVNKSTPAPARTFWTLQALSFAALVAIEAPWALAGANDTTGWNIAAEVCYFAYYACQFASAAPTRVRVIVSAGICAGFAAGLSALALTMPAFYETGRPSYLSYLVFDLAMVVVFWRLRTRSSGTWAAIFGGLAATSAVVFTLDTLDWLSYEQRLNMVAGMKTDILWTLPPLCYALVARAFHLGGTAAPLGKTTV